MNDLKRRFSSQASSPSPPGRNARFLSVTLCWQDDGRKPLQLDAVKEDKNGEFLIRSIGKKSALAGTLLQPQDKLIMANGKHCAEMSDSDLTKMLLHSPGHRITLVARNDRGDSELIESMVEKPRRNAHVGIKVSMNYGGALEISGLEHDGLYSDSLLAIGDRVLAINGVDHRCSTVSRARDSIRTAYGFLSILARRSDFKVLQELSLLPKGIDNTTDSTSATGDVGDSSHRSLHISSSSLSLAVEGPCVPFHTIELDEGASGFYVESPEFLMDKLKEFDAEVQKLTLRQRHWLNRAELRCPHLLTPRLKLKFLRQTVFNAKRAAVAYACYWNRRVLLYGPIDAFTSLDAW